MLQPVFHSRASPPESHGAFGSSSQAIKKLGSSCTAPDHEHYSHHDCHYLCRYQGSRLPTSLIYVLILALLVSVSFEIFVARPSHLRLPPRHTWLPPASTRADTERLPGVWGAGVGIGTRFRGSGFRL